MVSPKFKARPIAGLSPTAIQSVVRVKPIIWSGRAERDQRREGEGKQQGQAYQRSRSCCWFWNVLVHSNQTLNSSIKSLNLDSVLPRNLLIFFF